MRSETARASTLRRPLVAAVAVLFAAGSTTLAPAQGTQEISPDAAVAIVNEAAVALGWSEQSSGVAVGPGVWWAEIEHLLAPATCNGGLVGGDMTITGPAGSVADAEGSAVWRASDNGSREPVPTSFHGFVAFQDSYVEDEAYLDFPHSHGSLSWVMGLQVLAVTATDECGGTADPLPIAEALFAAVLNHSGPDVASTPVTPIPTLSPSITAETFTLEGVVTDGHGHQLPAVYVWVRYGTNEQLTYTGDDGRYRFQGLPINAAPGFDPVTDSYQVEVRLQFDSGIPDTPAFRVVYGTGTGPVAGAVTKPFPPLENGGTLARDIDLGKTADLEQDPVIPAAHLDDLAAIYNHTSEALALAAQISSEISLWPFDVLAFGSNTANGACWYGQNTPDDAWNSCLGLGAQKAGIGLGSVTSLLSSKDRPMNREWHEFGHHFMADVFGDRMPSHPGRVNHGGYCANDRSTDSWTEGFAEFFSMMVGREVADTTDFYVYKWDGGADVLELDSYVALNDEEFAVAALLLDLVDGDGDYTTGIDDDPVSIDFADLMDTIQMGASAETDGNGHIFDMVDLYRNLGAFYGGTDADSNGVDDLNGVFIAHGFFANNDLDQTYDAGERIAFTDHPAYTQGAKSCGAAPSRRNKPERPGSFVAFEALEPGGKAVEEVNFEVALSFQPPYDHLDLSYAVPAKAIAEGRLYLSLPPPGNGATATVTARAPGHRSSEALELDDETYWTNLSWDADTPLLEHTFTLRPNASPASRSGTLLYLGGAAAAVALIGIILMLGRRRRTRKAELAPEAQPQVPAAKPALTTRFCERCGSGVQPDDRFCDRCGHELHQPEM